MTELGLLRRRLEQFQDRENERAGKHNPIPLTVELLAAMIRQAEEDQRIYCGE